MSAEQPTGYMGMTAPIQMTSSESHVQHISPTTETNNGMEIWGLRSDVAALKQSITLLTAFIREQLKNEKELIACSKNECTKMEELRKEIIDLRKEISEMRRRMK